MKKDALQQHYTQNQSNLCWNRPLKIIQPNLIVKAGSTSKSDPIPEELVCPSFKNLKKKKKQFYNFSEQSVPMLNQISKSPSYALANTAFITTNARLLTHVQLAHQDPRSFSAEMLASQLVFSCSFFTPKFSLPFLITFYFVVFWAFFLVRDCLLIL